MKGDDGTLSPSMQNRLPVARTMVTATEIAQSTRREEERGGANTTKNITAGVYFKNVGNTTDTYQTFYDE